MPILTAPGRSDKPVKMLLLGDSGTGKSGALASLALAGYNLRILDFDNGTGIIASAIMEDKVATPAEKAAALSRCAVELFQDKFKSIGGSIIPDGVPGAFSNAMNLLDKWKTPEYDYGPIASWGPRDCIVIDSLTFMAMASLRLVLSINGRSGKKPYPADWGEAQDKIEGVLSILYSPRIKCNVIVLCHVNYMEIAVDSGERDKDGDPIMRVIDNKGLPMAVGKALSPKIPRYFNSALIAKRTGAGAGERRVLCTRAQGIVEAKTEFLGAPAELPISTGLAQFFRLQHGDPALLPTTEVKA